MSSNSDFSVRTGIILFNILLIITIILGPSNINTPLGLSASHDHYIQPVPGFVTEYEEKFVWPNIDYSSSPSRFGGKLVSPKSRAKYDPSGIKISLQLLLQNLY
jgi:hypothetical protein